MDNNRDGSISFAYFNGNSGRLDRTSAEKPYRFWIDNDNDKTNDSNSDHPWTNRPDCYFGALSTIRNLEDFTRLKLRVTGLHSRLTIPHGAYAVLKFREGTVEGNPSILVVPHGPDDGETWRSGDGGLGYLNDEDTARRITSQPRPISGVAQLRTDMAYTFGHRFWTDAPNGHITSDPVRHLLFHGRSEGKGELVLEFRDPGAPTESVEVGSCWLELVDVRKMYERAKATPDGFPDPGESAWVAPNIPAMGYEADPSGHQFQPSWEEDTENKNYIVFVHGWRKTYHGGHSYGITIFKRLWWAGYKGRYAVFTWPTYSFEMTPNISPLEAMFSKYNESEFRAWKSGRALKAYLESLPRDYKVNLIAHSMGNVVAGSALEMGCRVNNYALLQAAIPAACYDTSEELEEVPADQRISHPSARWLGVDYRAWQFRAIGNDRMREVAALGYKGRLENVTGNLISFYQQRDFATRDAWEYNNNTNKPWSHLINPGIRLERFYQYFPLENEQDWKVVLLQMDGTAARNLVKLRTITDPHEAMAMAARAKTKSVGAANEPLSGGIDEEINIGGGSVHDFEDVHNAEFARDIQRVRPFYDEILIRFDLKERD